MASVWEKDISILAGNLNSGRSYLTIAVAKILGETSEKKIPRLRWISKIFVKCVVKYILVMYGRVIYFFARQIEIGLYVGNDYELWCSIALHRVRFYKDSGITD